MTTILAAVDFSSITPRVVAEAANLARALAGRLVLLNVTAPPFIVGSDEPAAELVVDLTRRAAAAAAQKLARLQRKLETTGLRVTPRHRTNTPIAAILAEAKLTKARYIVLGSHGHGAVYDLLIGSTTAGVLKRTSATVLVVPAVPQKNRSNRKS
jgi:nucleotide-binding universal stress UspA family protein